MKVNSHFPWYFFFKVARFNTFVVLLAILATALVARYYLIRSLNQESITQLEEQSELLQKVLIHQQTIDHWCQQIRLDSNQWQNAYLILNEKNDIVCESYHRENQFEFNPDFLQMTPPYWNKIQTIFSEKYNHDIRYIIRPLQLDQNSVPRLFLIQAVPVQAPIKTLGKLNYTLLFILTPIFILINFFFIWFGISLSRPLKVVLNKIQAIESKLPYEQRLKFFYKRDEWYKIEAALKQAEEEAYQKIELLEIENEKITTLLESITDGILAVDKFQNALFYNTRFENVFLPPEIKLKTPLKLRKIFSLPELLDGLDQVLAHNQSKLLKGLAFDITINDSQDKESVYFDISINPLHDQDNKVVGAVFVFHDVTENKLTEQMRVDFVANVSHEVRTPLTSIKGFAQVLKANKDKVDSSLHDFLERILANSERLITLFNDLLNLSVIESHGQVALELVDFPQLVDSVKQNMRPIYEQKKLTVITEVAFQKLTADKKLLEQVLTNLLDNAIKYAPENSLIEIKAVKEETEYLISVHDHGQGIAKEHLNRIFERFYRVDSARTKDQGGTGIGLSLVKHIVLKHKGRVWAESTPSKGTTFYFTIPLSIS